MEIRKLSSPPEPEDIRSMVRYARNVIEEFRRAKHYKNILSSLFVTSIISMLALSACVFLFFPFLLFSLSLFIPWLWHPPVTCWRCASSAWRRWEQYSQTPTFTCFTWCTRPWASASTCRTGTDPWAMEKRSFSRTGKRTHKLWRSHLVFSCIHCAASSVNAPLSTVFTTPPTLLMWRLCIWNWDVCIWVWRRRHKEWRHWRRCISTHLIIWTSDEMMIRKQWSLLRGKVAGVRIATPDDLFKPQSNFIAWISVSWMRWSEILLHSLSSGSCHHGGGSRERSPLCSRGQARNRGAKVIELQQEKQKSGTSLTATNFTSRLHAMHLIPLCSLSTTHLCFHGSLWAGFLFFMSALSIFWLRTTTF